MISVLPVYVHIDSFWEIDSHLKYLQNTNIFETPIYKRYAKTLTHIDHFKWRLS